MKPVGLISAGVLLLLLGAVAPTFAQQDQKDQEATKQEQAKPEKQQQAKPEKQQQAKPAKQEKQQQAKPEKQQQAKPAKQEKQQQAKPEKQQQAKGQQEQQQKQQQEQAKSAKQGQQQQAKSTKQEQQQQAKGQQEQQGRQQAGSSQGPQRTQQAESRQRAEPALRLSARGEGRIPDDRFRSNFGSGHRFHIGSPRMVDGYSRFQYGGFWFGFIDPWPEGWYYTDDVYIDYVDGEYYLYNPYYPGVRIAICVVV